MNDDGGVDVGMDHGGETELKMQVHPLMVRSNAVPSNAGSHSRLALAKMHQGH